MKLPRDLSGTELIKLLCKHYGYGRVNQEGSHRPRNEFAAKAPHFHSRSRAAEDWNIKRDPQSSGESARRGERKHPAAVVILRRDEMSAVPA
jgi:hypothetical protein